MKRIAIAGAGAMARVRARALLSTGHVQICGIAARHLSSAQRFGAELGCEQCFDDVHRLADTRPDAILVEVPHETQDQIVLWAIDQHCHVLIGGSLATSAEVAGLIERRAQEHHLVVEAGYEARYSPIWETARQMLAGGDLGRLVSIRSIALWAGDPRTWYYHQHASGGMPITHMTYCFINPIRWLVGDPRYVTAFANKVHHTAPELVNEENVVANLRFDQDVLCSMTAGFVAPRGLPAWSVTFIGTRGALDVMPDEAGAGTLTVYQGEQPERIDFAGQANAFDAQARAFIAALDGQAECRNTPGQTIGDIRVAEAIVTSAHECRTVAL
ncbi:MAG: Gfo/Idh/MocA family oxidoreductase [Chloroflexi bacterium]|nr:Gfo/Idh/MocA family oxidoreductase [Chloroflexota bacterium]